MPFKVAPRDFGDKPDKAWMNHFHPDQNGRIVRTTLENGYRAYAPELVCVMTKWNNLHGGKCPHESSRNYPVRWGCGPWGDESPAAVTALASPTRKIKLAPGHWHESDIGTEPSWWSPSAAHKTRKMREELVARPADLLLLKDQKEARKSSVKTMRFARKPGTSTSRVGRDDPVEDGRDIAAAGDALPSDDRWQSTERKVDGVLLVTAEEKEIAELQRRGLLKGSEQLTLDSIAHDNEPAYSVRIVSKRQRGGKGKRKAMPVVYVIDDPDAGEREVEAAVEASVLEVAAVEAGIDVLEADGHLEVDMPECGCWGDFLADMQAEGWVPVVEDDLVSVAESWAVVEDDASPPS
ncbi:hypothetical protein B0H66DRAFT_561516 [Apodospora peruviana]|uniref:Uncharacterized protein n=1 Tax=Apodospora peruviana TaxID=516989 RepID=A0AAE0I1R8_9PEZI|nr:hypothetical protein B0H66DRAFT_561516 [Apodospora peruviana]